MKLKSTNHNLSESLKLKDRSFDEWHILDLSKGDVGTSIDVLRIKSKYDEVQFNYTLRSLINKGLVRPVTMYFHDRYEAIEQTEAGRIRMTEILEEIALRAL